MEQAGQRSWWPWALAGVVALILGCGFITLVFGGAAGWLVWTSRDDGGGAPPPAATAASAATQARPTVSTAAASAPTSAAVNAPTSAGAAEAPDASSPAEPQGQMVTYAHPDGWAVDLGTQWRVEDSEASGELNLYNYPADTPGSGAFEPGQTRIRIEPHGPAGTLADFVATFPTQMQVFEEQYPLLSEERWSLPAGLEAVRRDFDVNQQLLFVVNGLGYEALGMGEKAPFDEAMRTLRPMPTRAPGPAAGAQAEDAGSASTP